MILVMAGDDDSWSAISNALSVPIVTFGAMDATTRGQWQGRGVSYVIDPFTSQVLQVQMLENLYENFRNDESPSINRRALFEKYGELDVIAGFEELYAIEDKTVLKGESDG